MNSNNDPNQPDDQRLVKAALECFNDSASCEAFTRICARLQEFQEALEKIKADTDDGGNPCAFPCQCPFCTATNALL